MRRIMINQNEYVTAHEFREYIQFMRESVNLTQSEIAHMMGIPPTTYSFYERGKRLPDDPYAFLWLLKEVVRLRQNNQIKRGETIGIQNAKHGS